MATLYVENIPDELYEALREKARQNRKSIAAEVLALLEDNIPTPAELNARRLFLERLRKLRSAAPRTGQRSPSTEELQAEDRSR